MSAPIKTYYLQGYADAKDANRKRKRATPQNFKLVYASGWYDAKNGRPDRYEVSK